MPFIENSSNRPEWLKKYRDYCVIDTLESMFNQILGHPCIAPEAIYQIRDSQIERSSAMMPPGTDYRQRILQEMANARQNICRLISTWINIDPEMSGYLNVLDLRFVNLPYRELEKLATSGHAVGVTFIKIQPNGREHTGHMFHLRRHGLSLSPKDDSSQGGVRRKVQNFIRFGKMTRLVDETREICGYSALVISPWC